MNKNKTKITIKHIFFNKQGEANLMFTKVIFCALGRSEEGSYVCVPELEGTVRYPAHYLAVSVSRAQNHQRHPRVHLTQVVGAVEFLWIMAERKRERKRERKKERKKKVDKVNG